MRISDWSSDVCSSDLFYARQIATMTTRKVCVATAGMAVECGHVYLAPGDAHLRVVEGARGPEIALDRHPVENGCCPSADPMLDSVAALYGKRGVAVVLSGMGRDGAQGAAWLTAARSEEHTSELQSLMRNSYAVFCL